MILVPDDFGVSELITSNVEDRVIFVLGEGVAIVVRECEILSLLVGLVERVDSDYSVGLISEEAGCVVCVDNRRAGEDTGAFPRWVEGDRLVRPVVQVRRRGVTPVLVSSN